MRNATRIGVLLVAFGLLGEATPQETVTPSIDWNGRYLTFSNVKSHENLSLILICSIGEEENTFIPANLAMKKRWLRVGEGRSATVGTLQAHNLSRQPILIQDGDRFRGGKQDRIAGMPLVIPPGARSFSVPAYCVEKSRWGSGRVFSPSRTYALAPKTIRYAAKVLKDQGEVWNAVARVKKEAQERFGIPSKTSNLNEMLDHPQVKRMLDPFSRELGKVAKEDPNAIGVAILVGGRLEEVRIYPNHDLFAHLYPELLRSYAFFSKLSYRSKQKLTSLMVIAGRIRASIKKSGMVVKKDRWNSFRIAKMRDGVCSETRYKGKTVLLEWLAVPRTP